jgi:hypothetical protein
MDRAEYHGSDVYELLRNSTRDPDRMFSKIMSSTTAGRVILDGEGRRIKNAMMVAGVARKLDQQCRLVQDFSTSSDFEIWVDLTPHSVINKLTSIFRFTLTRTDTGKPGDRIPAVFFLPGTTRLQVCMGRLDNELASFEARNALPLHKTSRVAIRLSGEELTVCVDGDEVIYDKAYMNKHPGYKNVNIYAADEFNPPADCTLSNLLYLHLAAPAGLPVGATESYQTRASKARQHVVQQMHPVQSQD